MSDNDYATDGGLLAHWSFDEGAGKTVKDGIANIADPISYVFNEAAFTTSRDPQWRSGVKGSALLFDGYSTWVSRQAEDISSPTDALTITAWVAPRSYEGGAEQKLSAIVNQYDRAANQGYILGMYRHGAWSLQLGLGGNWEEVWAYDMPLVKNQWSFIAATFDKNEGIMKLYLNGIEAASKTVSVKVPVTPAHTDLLIGKNNECVVLAGAFELNMFNGLMDEVKIYGRALDDREIAEVYSEDVRPYGGEPPEIHYDDIKLDRNLLAADKHHPQYHLSPPAHWMNEPHAPIYFNGQYHLFYQHNPQGPYFHQIHWGHWVSDDLVHWRDLPIALAPEKNAVDPDGVWSGSAAYDENGMPALFFTAGDDSAKPNQRVGLARTTFLQNGDNDLIHWVKHPEPLIVQEKGVGLFGDFRDPFVWKEEDTWYLLIGSGIEGEGGTALAYTSMDMLNWSYKGPFHQTDINKFPYLGPVWELPVLLPLGTDRDGAEKYLFLISPIGPGADVEVFYWIGSVDKLNFSFVPDQDEPQLIDVGDFHFTGPSGMVDPKTGRKIIFTIAQGERTPELDYKAGWAHNGGLPLNVYLREDGRLGIEPIQELELLRGEKRISLRNQSLEQANALLKDIKGSMLEIQLEIQAEEARQVGIKVRCSPNGEEETLLYYDIQNSLLQVDRTKTTLDRNERSKGIQGGKLELSGENLKLHIYLDRSMIEAYANGLKSLTTRAYPSRDDALGIEVWGDGSLTVKSMEVWDIKSAW